MHGKRVFLTLIPATLFSALSLSLFSARAPFLFRKFYFMVPFSCLFLLLCQFSRSRSFSMRIAVCQCLLGNPHSAGFIVSSLIKTVVNFNTLIAPFKTHLVIYMLARLPVCVCVCVRWCKVCPVWFEPTWVYAGNGKNGKHFTTLFDENRKVTTAYAPLHIKFKISFSKSKSILFAFFYLFQVPSVSYLSYQ